MGQSNLRRLRYAASPSDLFADASSGYVYPAFEGLEVNCGITPYARPFQGNDHDHFAQALGERTAEIKITLDGRGFGGSPAGAGSAVQAGEGESGLMLKSIFGVQVRDTGSVCAASTTATVLKVTSTTNLSVGSFVGLVDPTSGLYHARQIRAKTSTDLTLDRALPFTPATSAVIYASATYSHSIAGHQHLWFDAEGWDADATKGWRRYVRGCLGDMELQNLAANGKLGMAFTFRGLDWDDAGQGSSQPVASYPANLPQSGGFVRNTRAWLGASQIVVAELGYKLGNKIEGKASTAAKNGIASWVVTDAEQTASFKIAADDAETAGLRTAWKAGTELDLLLELTQGGPGNSFAIAAPAAQVVGYQPSVLNGLDYFDVSLVLNRTGLTGVPAVSFGVL